MEHDIEKDNERYVIYKEEEVHVSLIDFLLSQEEEKRKVNL